MHGRLRDDFAIAYMYMRPLKFELPFKNTWRSVFYSANKLSLKVYFTTAYISIFSLYMIIELLIKSLRWSWFNENNAELQNEPYAYLGISPYQRSLLKMQK